MTELEKLRAGLEYCYDDEEVDVSQLFVTSVWDIFDTVAVKVDFGNASTVNVAFCPTRTLPISVSSIFARICFLERSAIRMMTVGLELPCTAIVPGVKGSPTTTPSIGAVMTVSARSDSVTESALSAVS